MKKRALSLFLALILCLGLAVPALAAGGEVVDSGHCGREGDGTNLSWTLTSDGTLTISGTGKMSSSPSWPRKQIVTVVIQEGVTTIGDSAFSNCETLTDVTLPEGLTTIGINAFSGAALTNVTLPESLTTIETFAFSDCALTDVTIPASVTTIGESPFAYCDALTSFTVEEGNPAYIAVDGVLFDKDKTALIQYPVGKTRTLMWFQTVWPPLAAGHSLEAS